MRNWNNFLLVCIFLHFYVFTVPMRNWNAILPCFQIPVFFVFTVPMRNWNCSLLWHVEQRSSVFTVPMRNWNPFLSFQPVYWPTGFYSTYEELKLVIIPLNFNILFCFYSTYEELKLRIPSLPNLERYGFLQYLWGIETTVTPQAALLLWLVFTVPMRNWNCKSSNDNHVSVDVFTVPMRNWNTITKSIAALTI